MQKKVFEIENKIYSDKSILTAIEDFVGFNIDYKPSKLTISGDSETQINEIFNEFMNYVLGIQNEII